MENYMKRLRRVGFIMAGIFLIAYPVITLSILVLDSVGKSHEPLRPNEELVIERGPTGDSVRYLIVTHPDTLEIPESLYVKLLDTINK